MIKIGKNYDNKCKLTLELNKLRKKFSKYIEILRRNPIKQIKIKKTQKELLLKHYNPKKSKLIIFLSPGKNTVNGGILSITSLFNETKRLLKNDYEILMCTLPGDPLLLNYTKFKNDVILFPFKESIIYFDEIEEIIIHIPEYGVKKFLENVPKKVTSKLMESNLTINILLQNIDYMSSKYSINQLKKMGEVTCTTAHERYSNQELRDTLGIPIHKLSVFITPEDYKKTDFEDKENIMIVSPDKHQDKFTIIKKLEQELPEIKLEIIENYTYEDYKNLITRSKWAITFGEGLDGYFLETIFSGGISFSVYNPKFFTDDFKSLKTVYSSYRELEEKIVNDLKYLNNKNKYDNYQCEQYLMCCKYYSYNKYIENLECYYKADYTFK